MYSKEVILAPPVAHFQVKLPEGWVILASKEGDYGNSLTITYEKDGLKRIIEVAQ